MKNEVIWSLRSKIKLSASTLILASALAALQSAEVRAQACGAEIPGDSADTVTCDGVTTTGDVVYSRLSF